MTLRDIFTRLPLDVFLVRLAVEILLLKLSDKDLPTQTQTLPSTKWKEAQDIFLPQGSHQRKIKPL